MQTKKAVKEKEFKTTPAQFYHEWLAGIELQFPDDRQMQDHLIAAVVRYALTGERPDPEADRMTFIAIAPLFAYVDKGVQRYNGIRQKRREAAGARWREKSAKNANAQSAMQMDANADFAMQNINTNTSISKSKKEKDKKVVADCDVAAEDSETLTRLRTQFEDFRKKYPGSKRGFKVEFDNFKKKHPRDWRQIVPLLLPALDRLIEWHRGRRAAGQFAPEFKNLSTWLNNECWTEELPPVEQPLKQTQNGPRTTPVSPDERHEEFRRHVIDKLTAADRPDPDLTGCY